MNWFKARVFAFLRKVNNKFGQQVIYNIGSGNHKKKALVSYITTPFTSISMAKHSNNHELLEIVSVLNRCGYKVDVVRLDIGLKIDRKYDLIFGQGSSFEINCKNNLEAKKIIYLTESSPDFSAIQESTRYKLITNRHLLKGRRTNKYLTNSMIDIADSAILVGNEETRNTYLNYDIYETTRKIKPTLLRSKSFILDKKRINKKNIIWFGSSGVIHKGLDLAINGILAKNNYRLYVAGCSKKDFEETLKELKLSPKDIDGKVIFKGRLTVGSSICNEIFNETSFSILPSCSEGMSTSILTCLAHGVIPILSKYTGVDCNDSVYIDDLTVQGIKKTLATLDEMSLETVVGKRERLISEYNDKFNLEYYHKELYSLFSGFNI